MTFPTSWNNTVTVYNRYKAQDNTSKLDTWHRTVLQSCFFSQQTVRSVEGQAVKFGTSVLCRIPENKNYKPYSEWKKEKQGFTLSLGDIVILGEISSEMTPSNRLGIINDNKPNAFIIEVIQENTTACRGVPHWRLEGS